jgi:hypothetical protein
LLFLDPGRVKSGSGINIPDPQHCYKYGLCLWIKIQNNNNKSVADPGSGAFSSISFVAVMFLDPRSGMGKNQDPGSGINIPDPQHCYKYGR